MVSELLYNLPLDRKYKIVFMNRKMAEILASQKKMLGRKQVHNPDADDKEMTEIFNKHLEEIKSWLALQDNLDVLYVSYNDIIKNPEGIARKVNRFLGEGLNARRMS